MKSKFLNILEQRGFLQDCTDMNGLDAYISECEASGNPAVAYIGFDCTAESLHAGSLLQIMALKWFQECGHKPIVLLGGGTTKIGDPSGKDESRKMLTEEQIAKNKAGIKSVFEKFIKFGNSNNDTLLVDNDEWLNNLNYIDFLREIGPHFTINRMLTFENVKRRLDREQPLTFLEFNYMILQSYDFVELSQRYGCRLQIGGSDQWGNIVNGMELNRRLSGYQETKINRKETPITEEMKVISDDISRRQKIDLFGLTTPLLTTSSGAKMGKTADGAIWLDEKLLKPYDYWQYWRNAEDADIGKFLKYFTTLDISEIEKLEKAEGAEINQAKIILANEATKLLHGEDAAKDAEATAKKVFEQGSVGGDLPVVKLSKAELDNGIPAMELYTKAGLCESNGEVKRLVKGGGAKINDKPINNHGEIINTAHLQDGKIKISAGKKKHAVVETD